MNSRRHSLGAASDAASTRIFQLWPDGEVLIPELAPDAQDLHHFGLVSVDQKVVCHTIVTSKMLYASHYFWTGLQLRALVPDPSRGAGFWFVTVNRSRSDGLSSFTGFFVRRRVRSEVETGALASLRSTKQRLENVR